MSKSTNVILFSLFMRTMLSDAYRDAQTDAHTQTRGQARGYRRILADFPENDEYSSDRYGGRSPGVFVSEQNADSIQVLAKILVPLGRHKY